MDLSGTPPPPGFDDALAGAAQPQQVAAASPQNALTGTAPPIGFEESLYGTPGQQAITGAEAFARGASLGTSDLFETKVLGLDPEDIKARQEANPGTAFAGNVLGAGALTALTGGAAAPAEGALLSAGAAPLAARALAYGAEGAIFGAGNTVSDYALGDPSLNAQKILTNIGIGAVLGGGIGAASYGLGKAFGSRGTIEKAVQAEADKANSAAETASALSGEGTPSGLPETGAMKKNALQIQKDQELLGAPSTYTLYTDNKWANKAADAVINGAPTFFGNIAADHYKMAYKAVTDTLDKALETGTEYGGGLMTKAQLGESMQGSLTSKIATENAPLKEIFGRLKEFMQDVPVPESERSQIANEILAMPGAKNSFPEGKMARRVAKDVLNIETMDDLKEFTSSLGRSVSYTASPGEKHMAGMLADQLSNLEEKSIDSAVGSLGPEARAAFERPLADRAAAKAAYKPFRQDLDTLLGQLGKKNAGGAQTAINFIQGLDPETLANKLFDKKFSSFNKFFAEKFPEEAALMRMYMKQTLKEGATKDGVFSPQTFFTSVKKLQPEIRSAIFHPDELAKIEAADRYFHEALPKNFNPSGTERESAFRAFFDSPTGAALGNVRDFGILGFLKAMSREPEGVRPNPYLFGSEMADKFNKMSAVDQIVKKQDSLMMKGAKAIFNPSGARGAAVAGSVLAAEHGYEKATKGVKNLAANPSGIVDHMVAQTGNLNQSLPNITQGLHATAMNALQFLNSKIPRPANTLPMSREHEPSNAEKAQYMRYYNAVNSPLDVLQDVRHGTLSNEAMEALQAVHPQLLAQMRQYVSGLAQTSKNEKLPYATKISIAKFLGTPLDSSMLPQVIQANQASLAGPQLGTQQAAKTGRRSNALMTMPQRSATQVRRRDSDEE